MLPAMRIVLTTLHSKFIHASLALPLLAAYCRHAQRTLLIREYTVHEPKETVLAALLAEQPDVVAFSVYLWNRAATLELADTLVTARPGLRSCLRAIPASAPWYAARASYRCGPCSTPGNITPLRKELRV
jgi:anaerobic magnesium-protoporphyrin IX monomethyl ester cyclase